MRICEGTIPATTEAVRTDDGWIEKPVPARPCDAEATVLARSMRQVKCELFDQLPNPQDGIHWLTVEDHYFCNRHYRAGAMSHLDGRVTNHAPMPVEA
ncbi:MAG: hypothetical protein AB7P40_16640 [Chloroflexota bacterium]